MYEALMTMRTRNIHNLTVFIDVNEFQSDNLCSDIKLLPQLAQLFSSFGFTPITIDGNDCAAVADAWLRAGGQLTAIIAHTSKPAGTQVSFLSFYLPRNACLCTDSSILSYAPPK